MTIKEIADKVAAYHQQSRATLVDGAGQDLVITALNHARKSLEQLHDFNYCQESAWLSIDPDTGGLLTSAKLMSGNTPSSTVSVDVKSVDTVYLQDLTNTEIWYPIYFKPKKTLAIASKEILHRYRFNFVTPTLGGYDAPLVMYPGDARNSPLLSQRPVVAYAHGQRMFLDPKQTTTRTIKLDVVRWMTGYLQNTTVSVSVSSTGSASVTLTSTAPSDLVVGTYLLGRLVTVVSGTAVTLAGNANQTIAAPTLVAYSNMKDWLTQDPFTTNEAYTDWLTDKGSEFLMWAGVVELNHLTTQFVNRQEGFAPVPEKTLEKAYTALVEWDNFLWEQGRQPWALR